MQIVPATDAHFAWILGAGPAIAALTLPEGGIASDVVIAHIRDIAKCLNAAGYPGGWLIVAGREVVGLCGYHAPPADKTIEIGYNVAPERERRGYATRAIALVVEHTVARDDVDTMIAHTAPENIASQRVLQRNGFERAGDGVSHGDPVIRWTRNVRSPALREEDGRR